MSKPRIDAVVFDTNVFGAGMSVGILSEWKELLARRGMELWIPELVLWEAAVHVADAALETGAQFKKGAKLLKQAGISVDWEPNWGNRQEIIEVLLEKVKKLGPEVVIVPCSGEDALNGLRDQVMQSGPGSLKSGVRTGAVDGAWLRGVMGFAARGDKSIVIISNDDVERVKDQWELTVYRNTMLAKEGLFQYRKASPQAIRDVLEFLAESQARFGSGDGLFDTPDFDDLDELFRVMGGGDGFGFREADAQIRRLGDLIGLKVVETDPKLGALEVVAWFLADLELQGWFDVDSDGDIRLRMRSEDFLDCVLKMPLSLSASQGQINFGTLAAPVEVSIRSERTSGDEALLAIVEALSLVPGLEDDDMLADLEDRGEWEGKLIDGRSLALSVYETDPKSPGESSSMEARIDQDRLVVSWRCTPNFSIYDGEYLDESECYFIDEDAQPGLWRLNIWLLEKMRSQAE